MTLTEFSFLNINSAACNIDSECVFVCVFDRLFSFKGRVKHCCLFIAPAIRPVCMCACVHVCVCVCVCVSVRVCVCVTVRNLNERKKLCVWEKVSAESDTCDTLQRVHGPFSTAVCPAVRSLIKVYESARVCVSARAHTSVFFHSGVKKQTALSEKRRWLTWPAFHTLIALAWETNISLLFSTRLSIDSGRIYWGLWSGMSGAQLFRVTQLSEERIVFNFVM